MRSFTKIIRDGYELWKCLTCKATAKQLSAFPHKDDCRPDEAAMNFAHKPNLKGSVDRTDKGYPR